TFFLKAGLQPPGARRSRTTTMPGHQGLAGRPPVRSGQRAAAGRQEVPVHLHRFKLTAQFQLAEVLKAMGMTRVFTPGEADLSGMTRRPQFYVTAVVHKAFVDVNEEGMEATAATGSSWDSG